MWLFCYFKFNMYLSYDPIIPFLISYPREMKAYTQRLVHQYASQLYFVIAQKLETTKNLQVNG